MKNPKKRHFGNRNTPQNKSLILIVLRYSHHLRFLACLDKAVTLGYRTEVSGLHRENTLYPIAFENVFSKVFSMALAGLFSVILDE